MAVALPRPPSSPIAPTPAVLESAKRSDPEWWVEVLRWVALAVFIALPFFAFFFQAFAGRVVWTIVVAALPLFIVLVGYYRWRRICPLAFFAQIPVWLRRPGTRRASQWSETHYYFIAFAVFFFSLWLRLIATNGDGHAITIFFVLLSLAALIIGAVYTGKSWCNYICPVSFIEKIYTEPQSLQETENSQCEKCSACKKFCPDINEENGYWKEIALRSKRAVYFAFPGLVFAFYFYYYLQAGTWDYYFGGRWTNEPGVIRSAFLPGHDAATAGFFFLPVAPRALAAAITLLFLALASYLLFSACERAIVNWLRRRESATDLNRARHITFSIAAFTAFIVFYSFAGQPSLRKLTFIPAPQLASIVVVITATLFLIRRLRRTPQRFAEETLARSIIKRWQWTDIKPPKDLREAFLIHTIRSRESVRESAKVLEVYKDSVREALANGFVTREEVHLLEHLRNQLKIKRSDHEEIMASLADEERALLSDPSKQLSAEKRLQLTTYLNALKRYIERVLAADGNPDDKFIMRLRSEYAVTRKEHRAVLDELLGGDRGMAARLAEALRTIERAEFTIKALELSPSPTHDFLADILRRRHARAVDNLMHGLSFSLPDEETTTLRLALNSSDQAFRESIIEQLRSTLSRAIAERLITAYRETVLVESSMPTLTDMLAARLQSADPYVRAVALVALGERGAVNSRVLEVMLRDEHEVVRETARQLQHRAAQALDVDASLMIVEKMIALREAPIFATLAPEGLAELARASREDEFPPGAEICAEGEPGEEVFILLAGEIEVLGKDGAGEKIVSKEKQGGFIGELAVLDPAPRSARLRAGKTGVRVLRLNGEAFREAVDAEPSIASQVIRTLAQRLRRKLRD
jgi:hypothetical protein